LVIIEQDRLLKEHDHQLVEWALGPFAMPTLSRVGDEDPTVVRLQSARGVQPR
jgi:hypothetical protein